MQIDLKTFDELTGQELYTVLQLRNTVFVVEQNCPYIDTDDKDQKATHLMMWEDNHLVGYARILAPGVSYKEPSIGRVVTPGNQRGKGLGKQLMDRAVKETKRLYPHQEIVISAQAHLCKFYTELGFVIEGDIYPEDNIPHQKMRYRWFPEQNSILI